MASGSPAVALHEAADLLGVSVDQLNRRIEGGNLPEATETESGAFVIERDQLTTIADREGWIIDVREDGDQPSAEFSEMLERLLGLGQQLITETSARKVTEAELGRATEDLEAARYKSFELEGVIEELEAENVRLGKDLEDARATVQVSDALATERFETILDLQSTIEQTRLDHQIELDHHRRQEHDLRDRVEAAQASMGWWSRRRYRKF